MCDIIKEDYAKHNIVKRAITTIGKILPFLFILFNNF